MPIRPRRPPAEAALTGLKRMTLGMITHHRARADRAGGEAMIMTTTTMTTTMVIHRPVLDDPVVVVDVARAAEGDNDQVEAAKLPDWGNDSWGRSSTDSSADS